MNIHENVYGQPPNPSYRIHARFWKTAVKDNNASLEAGHPVYKDVDMVTLTAPGDNKQAVERRVTEQLIEGWKNGNRHHPPQPGILAVYEAWKKDEELPVDGTPLKTWPPITPAQLEACKATNLHTVEDLANANEDAMRRIGMGARALVQTARNWLADAAGNKSAAQLAALQQENETLKNEAKELREAVRTLQKQMETLRPAGMPNPGHVQTAAPDVAAEYEATFGKKPHHKMKPETMRERIEEARGQ